MTRLEELATKVIKKLMKVGAKPDHSQEAPVNPIKEDMDHPEARKRVRLMGDAELRTSWVGASKLKNDPEYQKKAISNPALKKRFGSIDNMLKVNDVTHGILNAEMVRRKHIKEETLNELSTTTLRSIRSTVAKKLDKGSSKNPKKHEEVFWAATKKLVSRGKGVKEEVEPVEELSKATLGSYVKKASTDVDRHRSDSDNHYTQAQYKPDSELTRGTNKSADQVRKDLWHKGTVTSRKVMKRHRGIEKAVNRLTKEEVELRELSSELIQRYRNRAATTILDKDANADEKNKRMKGNALATRKQQGPRANDPPKVATVSKTPEYARVFPRTKQPHR